MTIDSIGAATGALASPQDGARTRGAQDFAALSQALQQGDLTGAQQAFASLQQDVPWVGRAASAPSAAAAPGAGPLAAAIQDLGNALKSGDLAGAQKAFAALSQAHGGHHGHHHRPDASTQAAPAPAVAAANGTVDTHA